MIGTTKTPESSASLVLHYRLTEDDVHHYCVSGRARKCWRACRGRKVTILILAALGLFLIGICLHARGVRAGALAIATTLTVLAVLTWSRQALVDHRVCRLARAMGLPEDFRLVVSPEGIVEEPGPDSGDPSRTFAWSDVLDILRIDRLTVVHLRPGGCVLMVPDRVFSRAEDRSAFVKSLRTWRQSARRGPPG